MTRSPGSPSSVSSARPARRDAARHLGARRRAAGAMLLFVGHSLGTMTARCRPAACPSIGRGRSASYGAARRVAGRRRPAAGRARGSGRRNGAVRRHRASSTGWSDPLGCGLDSRAYRPGYADPDRTLRFLRGSIAPRAWSSSTSNSRRPSRRSRATRCPLPRAPARPPSACASAGVALVTAPDLLFQPLNPLVGPAPAQPPANIAILPLATFAAKVAPALAVDHGAAPAAAAVAGSQSGIQWQVQAQVDPAVLTGSPSSALTEATRIRNRVERSLPGQVVFVDNLESTLNGAAGDALYAETLYIMLAVPGALVALGLAYLAALGTVERDRRDLALLRARGARAARSPLRSLQSRVCCSAFSPVRSAPPSRSLPCTLQGLREVLARGAHSRAFGICVALAVVGAAAARIGAGLSAFRASVSENRRSVRREHPPLWQRLYLDVLCLVVSGPRLLAYRPDRLLGGRQSGFEPDAVALGLHVPRARAAVARRGTPARPAARERPGAWIVARAAGESRDDVARLPARQRRPPRCGDQPRPAHRRAAARVRRQPRDLHRHLRSAGASRRTIDRRRRRGRERAGRCDRQERPRCRRSRRAPGVAGATPVDHSYAYVGPDLQDIFGDRCGDLQSRYDAAGLATSSAVPPTTMLGAAARRARRSARLEGDDHAITRLQLGDLLRLRVLDHTAGRFQSRAIPRRRDRPGVSLSAQGLVHGHEPVATSGQSPTTPGRTSCSRPRAAIPTRSHGASATQTSRYGTAVQAHRPADGADDNSITTVDLRGISRIEEVFALVLAAAAMALFVARRTGRAAPGVRDDGRARGLAARRRRVPVERGRAGARRVRSCLPPLLGWLLAEMLVAMLQHVFDPPPDHLAVAMGVPARARRRRRSSADLLAGALAGRGSGGCRSARSCARSR